MTRVNPNRIEAGTRVRWRPAGKRTEARGTVKAFRVGVVLCKVKAYVSAKLRIVEHDGVDGTLLGHSGVMLVGGDVAAAARYVVKEVREDFGPRRVYFHVFDGEFVEKCLEELPTTAEVT